MTKQDELRVAVEQDVGYTIGGQSANLDNCKGLPTDHAHEACLFDTGSCKAMNSSEEQILIWKDKSTAVLAENPKVTIRFAPVRQEGYVDVVLGIVLKSSPNLLNEKGT